MIDWVDWVRASGTRDRDEARRPRPRVRGGVLMAGGEHAHGGHGVTMERAHDRKRGLRLGPSAGGGGRGDGPSSPK
uniref:Uncharacterized protein n=1 Tax=Arundo donax TaxID=35708 RepID=A0A0A9GQG4_ARUDO